METGDKIHFSQWFVPHLNFNPYQRYTITLYTCTVLLYLLKRIFKSLINEVALEDLLKIYFSEKDPC